MEFVESNGYQDYEVWAESCIVRVFDYTFSLKKSGVGNGYFLFSPAF